MRTITIILGLCTSLISHAKDTLVYSSKENKKTYTEYLKLNLDYSSFTSSYVKIASSKDQINTLLDSFEQGQIEYFKGNYFSSKKHFLAVTTENHSSIWPREIRKIILVSSLRLAEMENIRHKKIFYIKKRLN